MQIMTTSAVSQLIYLLDEAFQGTDWHSVLANLHTVTPEDWLWIPPGGQRSIRDIVRHIGACKYMYHSHTFDDAHLTWDDPLAEGHDVLSTIAEALAWLREAQARLRQSIAALSDADLLRPRLTSWDEPKETRWIINMIIQHDLYHAGEINLIRALHQQNDL